MNVLLQNMYGTTVIFLKNNYLKIQGVLMKKFRTIVSLIAMALAGVVGFFIGSALKNAFGGAILFSLIAGIACVVYTVDNRDE